VHSRAQAWYGRRTWHWRDWPAEVLLEGKRRAGTRISVVIPARNEERTIAGVVGSLRAALVERTPLIDEVVVIDSDSADGTAAAATKAGATVHWARDIAPELGGYPGKGEALWKSLLVTEGDLLVFIDADLTQWGPHFVTGLLGPLLAEPGVQLVKGFYARIAIGTDGSTSTEGGRVTELVARPLLSLWWPELSGVVQPLAGEWAARRELMESLSIPVGYGVELSTLLDTAATRGLDAIAQVDLGSRGHKHQTDHDLALMAAELLIVAERRRPVKGAGEAGGGVMCPSYLATRDEKDSTRGRSRVLQELANGTLVKDFRSAEVAESLDLCLSCKGCSSDCPAGVDMATYKAEVLYQKYRRRPRPPAHYSLGWLPRWARLASHAPGLANAALRNPALAGLAKRLGGIDARRPLPQFAAQSFRAWFAGRPPRAGAPVLLWVDTFTDYFTPEVGQAAVRVLEAAGYAVEITGQPVCCGLTWISTGQLDGARTQLRRSLQALEPAVRAGTPIVGLEPSCTAVLRGEIAELLPADPRARQVRTATRTLAELLTETTEWTAPDLTGVRAVAQPHCHHHAVMGWHTDSALLASAGAEVTAVGGCCGLAGNFGVERGHYDVSRAVAETALLPAVRDAKDAVVLVDGFSCRTQLDQLAHVSGTHLAQLLASRLEDGR